MIDAWTRDMKIEIEKIRTRKRRKRWEKYSQKF